MVRYKMLARDVDSNPTQYRTWVVPNTPDFTGEYYTGLKSGDNPFVDVSAYLVLDGYDGYSLDFNYPLATLYPNALNWSTTRKVLPEAVYDGQLCVADGYAYIFGGNGSDKIFKADLNNPCDWEDTQAVLPSELYGSQLAIINGYIYLFGGNNGSTSNNIYSAPVSDPLNWTDHGPLLPKNIESSQLAIIDGYIYLFGGSDGYSTISNILKADVSTPLVWQDTGYNLPVNLRSSHLGIIDGYVYLFGGITSSNNPTDLIYRAELLDPTSWGLIGALPYAICNGNFFTIGAQGYLIAPGADPGIQTYQTKIFKCNLSTPYSWVDTKKTIPGDISYSQLAVIYDRVFLFGGNGNSVIYSNKSIFKYSFGDPKITIYDDVTRTQYNSTPNVLDLFKVIGFQPWRTDYGS